MKRKLTINTVKNCSPKKSYYKIWDTDISGFFLRVLSSGTKTYCLYYRHLGKAREFTIGNHPDITAAQARTIAKEKLGAIAKGIDVQQEKQNAKAAMEATRYQTLGGFIDNKYRDWILAERKSGEDTLYKLKQNFEHLYTRNLQEITAWDIQKWRSELVKKGLQPSTINRRLMALKAVLSKAIEWGIIESNPIANVKAAKLDEKSKVRYLEAQEEKRLRKALIDREKTIRTERASANEWRQRRSYALFEDLSASTYVDYLQPMVLLAMNTGMRRGELFNLTWKHVDLEKAQVTIEGKTSKSGQSRYIPLNAEALGTLIAWKNQTEGGSLVFPNPNTGKRFDNIATSWQGLLKLAKIDKLRFHDLRHHFASKLVMAGVDLNTVRELLGHADLTMTLRYAHLAPEHKAAAVAVLNNPGKFSNEL